MPLSSNSQSGESASSTLHRLFITHPASVGESYFEHQRVALGYSAKFLWLTVAAFTHALIPGLCQRTARDEIARLHSTLQTRSTHSDDR